MLEHRDFPERDLSSLTKVASGGAPVYPAVVERWESATGVYIHNAYGLTETAAPSHLVPSGVARAGGRRQRRAVRRRPDSGHRLEAWCASTTAATCRRRGRRDRDPRPRRLARVLATAGGQSPRRSVDGWLHTGDVGTRDDDGWFYLVDRIKDMVNVSGYKVWPREVEDVRLPAHPPVLEASVVGAPDDYPRRDAWRLRGAGNPRQARRRS